MAKNVTDNLAAAGRSLGEAAKQMGQKIVDGTSRAMDAVADVAEGDRPLEGSDAGVAGIREHMQVIASCGKCVGVVDSVDTSAIKLTRKDSPDGQHHFIPKSWIDHVDSHVHLRKNSVETELNWKSSASACNCG